MSEQEEKETSRNYQNKKFFKFTAEVTISSNDFFKAKAKAQEMFGTDFYESHVSWEQLNKSNRYQFDADERKDIVDT